MSGDIDKAIGRALDARGQWSALSGATDEELRRAARSRAVKEEAELRALVDALARDRDDLAERNDQMAERAMRWEHAHLPVEDVDRITFAFDASVLRFARNFREVAVEGVKKIIAEAERHLADGAK